MHERRKRQIKSAALRLAGTPQRGSQWVGRKTFRCSNPQCRATVHMADHPPELLARHGNRCRQCIRTAIRDQQEKRRKATSTTSTTTTST